MTFAAAIDFGGTKTLVGIVEASGEIKASRRFATNKNDNPAEHFIKCWQSVDACCSELGISSADIAGIGVTVPGMADPTAGLLLHAPFLGWKNVAVREILASYWPDKRIMIANDVNACALAERMFGKGKEYQNLLWVTVSTGIGGGLLLNGQIYEGEHLIAGEIGHIVVEWEHAERCSCGNKGCLEAHASGTAIADAARRLLEKEGADSPLGMYFAERGLEITALSVAQAANDHVQSALDIYLLAGRYMGRAFSYAANLLNPGAIIVGGGVSLSFDLLKQGIAETLSAAVIGESNRELPVLVTGLGYEAGLKGAASLVFHRMDGIEDKTGGVERV